ncbi:MAG: hypothetical protein ACK4WB_03875 [Desulfatiglandales bacterium]
MNDSWKKRGYLIRIESCIRTILDVKKVLESSKANLQILNDVREIELASQQIDPDLISEEDVSMLEEATNKLMRELKPLWEADSVGYIYKDVIH